MAWIEVHDTLPDHPKVLRAAKALKLDSDALVGKLVRLWVWALGNREDGILSDLDAERLDRLINYNGRADKLIAALTENRLLDVLPDGRYLIHDWDEHVMMLRDKREENRKKSADRVRRYRERQKRMGETDCNALQERYNDGDRNGYMGEDCNACNARTVPNRTVPKDDNYDDPNAIHLRAREAEGGDVDKLWISQTQKEITRVFGQTVGREATQEEVDSLVAQTGAEGGMATDMIELALSKALLYGAASVTAYACKVLMEWRRNGIFTPEEVSAWESGRGGPIGS